MLDSAMNTSELCGLPYWRWTVKVWISYSRQLPFCPV
jgi:hypothetical protein